MISCGRQRRVLPSIMNCFMSLVGSRSLGQRKRRALADPNFYARLNQISTALNMINPTPEDDIAALEGDDDNNGDNY